MLKCVGIIDFTNVPFYRDYRVGVTENCLISSKMEPIGLSRVCHRISHFKEVNDINDFEALKLGGTIEWE